MNETCTHCGEKFLATQSWANRTQGGLLVTPGFLEIRSQVRCPSCVEVFSATQHRYLGFISPLFLELGVVMSIALTLVYFLRMLVDATFV